MSERVQIVRDTDGIAHVRASTLGGAFFGQGHAAATDRLWQMELDRRRATGTLAALVGRSGLDSDIFYRRAGVATASQRDLEHVGDDARRALTAYAAGVNAGIADLTASDRLPPELGLLGAGPPAPWLEWHSLAVYQFRHLLMGTYSLKRWRSALVRNLGPEAASRLWPTEPGRTIHPDEAAIEIARGLPAPERLADVLARVPEESAASNNVAIDASRTTTGAPLLAGDPHRTLDLPNVYWQNHLSCPESDTIGLSFPGVPGFPHFGHNADVAWCITHGMADDQDVFLEEVRPDGADRWQVRRGSEWQAAEHSTEVIDVRDDEPVTLVVVRTPHGPLIAGPTDGYGLALQWTATAAPDTTFDALVPMLLAESVSALDEAMRPWVVPVNNVLMADRGGHIRYRLRGRLARRHRANAWTIVPGWDSAHDWQGFVAYDEQATFTDPACGFLVTANNRVSAGGPYVTEDFAHPARAERLTEIAASRRDWDAESLVTALGDVRSLVAPGFVDRVLAVDAGTEGARDAQKALHDWDGDMAPDSVGATVYTACRIEIARLIGDSLGRTSDTLGAFGPGVAVADRSRLWWSRLVAVAGADDDSALVDAFGGWEDVASRALDAAADRLRAELGPDPAGWRWGAVHRSGFVHPLAALRPDLAARVWSPPSVELGGDSDCVRASGLAPPGFEAVTGSVARYVFDLADWDRSRWIVPHGVSGDPSSPHNTDQLADWAAIRTRPMRWSASAVDAAAASVVEVDVPAAG